MKLILYVVIVQIILNPFVVFIWSGVIFGGGWPGVFIGLIIASLWYMVWMKVRTVNIKLDAESMKVWK